VVRRFDHLRRAVDVPDVARLKESWSAVARHGDEVPLFFYSNLFLTHPETRDMFPVSMAGQRDKLVTALGRIVSNVDNLDELVPFLRQLGRDHRKFTVVAEHYPAVGASLLATLEHFLGPEWTPELAADWTAAYGLVAKVMVEAAQDAATSSPPWWEAQVVSHERRAVDIAVMRLRPTQPLPYRAGQAIAIESDLRPRLWRYYSPANAPGLTEAGGAGGPGDGELPGEIELHVRLVVGGSVSAALVQALQVGDVLRLGAPVGQGLTLTPRSSGDLLLVAGGTGLAPLRALVEQLILEQAAGVDEVRPRQVCLFVGGRTERDLYDLPALLRLARDHGWLEVIPVVSDDLSYPGERGMAVEAALRHGPWVDPQVYVCGSPEMVAGSVERLSSAGIPLTSIHVDDFGPDNVSTMMRREVQRELSARRR
jgi:NAD(P)H-flavin reductase/hemoglobin-like flavoprotein